MTLILGSSLGTTRALWRWQEPLLDLGLLAYDHRGHGSAPTPPGPWELGNFGRDVLALMDREGIERASVGGISLGGMVAMWLGIHAPERVEKLVLLCTTAYFPDKGSWRDRITAVRQAGTLEVVADAVAERWLTPGYAAAHPDVVAELRGMLVSTPVEGYVLACEAIANMDLRPELHAIEAPALVISAAGDPATTPPMQHELADLIPDARLETIEGAHIVNVEQPDTVNRLISEFLHE